MKQDDLAQLFNLIATLRGPGGCPWDQKQTFEDVVSDLIEESYELEWAVAHHGDAEVLDEMGDVLFLLCFALFIRQETHSDFTLGLIARHAHDKIYNRHPHVFGDARADTADESIVHWEKTKAREREQKDPGGSALNGVAGNLPPLRHAEKVQQRAASVGFDWNAPADIIAKVREETAELEDAMRTGESDDIEHELGDLLFSIVNIVRFLKFDSERALNRSTSKFVDRFKAMEKLIAAYGKHLPDMSLTEMDTYWDRVKASE